VKELYVSQTRRQVELAPDKKGKQITVSENHNWNGRRNKPSSPGDVGGPFFTEKSGIRVVNPTRRRLTGSIQWDQNSQYWSEAEYIGPVLACSPSSAIIPSSAKSSKSALLAMGTEAIARCKPTNSVADVATAIAELYSEGLPKLAGSAFWERKAFTGREIGDEYLNQEFGWKPMVSDVRSICEAVASSHAILKAYEEGSGSIVRRRYEFPESYSETTVQGAATDFAVLSGSNSPALRDPLKPPAVLYQRSVQTKKVWFSGAFTYHLPTGFKSRNAMERLSAKANVLLGTDLTPEVLWNAMPWSWAVDWFSNAGDVISNLSDWSTDGLVLKYGYVMEHSSASNTYFQIDGGKMFTPNIIGSPVVAYVETKQREVATPFGFGLNWDAFSPRQWAITAALGLSNQKRL